MFGRDSEKNEADLIADFSEIHGNQVVITELKN